MSLFKNTFNLLYIIYIYLMSGTVDITLSGLKHVYSVVVVFYSKTVNAIFV